MARLNITIPDGLYARLEQIRDRINLSKVCANALEKEATMLEGQPNITDPRIAQLLQRLQSVRERWYKRGYDDGTQWAIELATREELWTVAASLAHMDGHQLVEHLRNQPFLAHPPHQIHIFQEAGGPPPPPHPPTPPPPPMGKMMFTQAPEMGGVMHSKPAHSISHWSGMPPFVFPASFHPEERLQHWENHDLEGQPEGEEGLTRRVEIDEAAYIEGWRDAVKGIWQTIAPALS